MTELDKQPTEKHCGKCGAFVSERKNHYMQGATTVILMRCAKCGAVLAKDWEAK